LCQEDLESREKDRMLSTEVEVLKERFRGKEQEARDCYSREEKT